MKIAVITLTRDRLDYTKYCFGTLDLNAGCDYEHYVLDNGSTDGTSEWLTDELRQGRHYNVLYSKENLGVCAGANRLLDLLDPSRYDVIIRFDNDCEVIQPDTLKACAEAADEYGAIVAPRVLGLLNPPPTLQTVRLGDQLLDETAILGGIFMAIPANLFWEHGYRFDEQHPKWSGDEAIVPFWRSRGGVCGYLRDYAVNHFETTLGQRATYPEYEARKLQEIAA